MGTSLRRRHDSAHHHPFVHREEHGAWSWQCRCGGASCRTPSAVTTWRQVVVQALAHSADIAA